MVQTGTHSAKVVDYGVRETKTGNPYIRIVFHVEGQGEVSWDGHLTEKTIKRTLESLTYCGFKSNDLSILADGTLSAALDLQSAVNIVVEHEPDQKDPKKKWARVKWINRAGQNLTLEPAKAQAMKVQLSQFKGALKQVQTELGVKAADAKIDVGF